MSESAEDRSKRKFNSRLLSHKWAFKYSIFYNSYDVAKEAVDHAPKIRIALRKELPTTAFVWRLILSMPSAGQIKDINFSESSGYMPIHTFFMSEKIDIKILKRVAASVVSEEMTYCVAKSVSRFELERYATAIKNQRPHDLKSIFGDRKLNRVSFSGMKHAIPFVEDEPFE